MVVFKVGDEFVAVDASGRVVARGEDAYVLQYALDNYFSVFIRRGPRLYVVKFGRLFQAGDIWISPSGGFCI